MTVKGTLGTENLATDGAGIGSDRSVCVVRSDMFCKFHIAKQNLLADWADILLPFHGKNLCREKKQNFRFL